MLHDTHSGYLQLKDRMELVNKIEELSGTQALKFSKQCRFLLDIDTNWLAEGDIDSQDWYAMEAATAALGRPKVHVSPATTTHPIISVVVGGAYTVMEEIRQERQYSWGMRLTSVVSQQDEQNMSESHQAAQLGSK